MNKELIRIIKEAFEGLDKGYMVLGADKLVEKILEYPDVIDEAVKKSSVQKEKFIAKLNDLCKMDRDSMDTGYVRYKLVENGEVLIERLRVSIGISRVLDAMVHDSKEYSKEDLLVLLVNKGGEIKA